MSNCISQQIYKSQEKHFAREVNGLDDCDCSI